MLSMQTACPDKLVELGTNDTKAMIIGPATEVMSLKGLNLVVFGKIHAGKTVLLKTIFGEELFRQCIPNVIEEQTKEVPRDLSVYEATGFESIDSTFEDVMVTLMKRGTQTKKMNMAIHCIWYCIRAHSTDFDPVEIELLKRLSTVSKNNGVLLIIVLTQCIINAQDIQNNVQILKRELPDVDDIIPVLAANFLGESNSIERFGLDDLIVATRKALPLKLKRIQEIVSGGKCLLM